MDFARVKARALRALDRPAVRLPVATIQQFLVDKAPRLAAALAYYSLFSIGPLLLISIAVAGFFFGTEAVREQVLQAIANLVGDSGAEAFEAMTDPEQAGGKGAAAWIVGGVVLLLGAMGVFNQLQTAFDTIWDVERTRRGGWKGLLLDRLLSLGMVLATGFLLLVSLLMTSFLALAHEGMRGLFPGSDIVWFTIEICVSVVVITGLFAIMFRYLSDKRPRWRDVGLGALFTSGLFHVGQLLIGLYIARSVFAKNYGAASAIIACLVWVYYSSLIIFLGAEFTQVWTERHHKENKKLKTIVKPKRHSGKSSLT